jgi:beta-glucanase (GH16 family)
MSARGSDGRRAVIAVLLVACGAVVAIVAVRLSTTATVAGIGATNAPCGANHIAKPGGGDWTCTFDDEFSGTSLSSTRWTAMETATDGFSGGQECDRSQNVSISGGTLVLSATRLPSTVTCGHRTTSYASGMISSQGKFAQAYGRFQMRAKFPHGIGFQPAFWLLPENSRGTGRYEYGEIDIAEEWGNYPQFVDPHLHYVATPDSPAGGMTCTIATNATAFHTYTLEWTPTQMRFIYDKSTCWTTTWLPQADYAFPGAQPPVPFDQPFYVIVQLAVGGAKTPGNEPLPTTPFPAQMDVDYVRVWR